MSNAAAEEIYSVMKNHPEAVIVWATGHSPLLAYQLLIKKIRETNLDVSRMRFVKLDEWMGLKCTDEATCEYFLQKEIIEPLQISEKQYLHFDPEAADMFKECQRVEEEYQNLPKVDLVILGIGMNGHLGLNEPGSSLIENAHVVVLDEKTRTHEMLTHTSHKVTGGVTLGMRDLFKGEKILLLADGAQKERGMEYYLNEQITTEVPVSFLKLHPNCQCIVNAASFPESEVLKQNR